MTAKIVIYGVDGVLLHTRQVILRSAGLRHTLMVAVDKLGKRNLRKQALSKQDAEISEANTKVLQTPASPLTFIATVQDSIQ